MNYDINKLSAKINKVKKELNDIDTDNKIKKYGTFLDSKEDIIQLYILFIFFGIHKEIIYKFPITQEYDLD